jgi:hypothetical protein
MKLVVTFVTAGLTFALSLVASAQEAKIAEDVPAVIRKAIPAIKLGGAAAQAKEEPKKDEEAAVEVPRAPVVPLGPKFIRLHLQDGSVISGDLSVAEISVETQFGKLVVPIEKLRSFTPGLIATRRWPRPSKLLWTSFPAMTSTPANKLTKIWSRWATEFRRNWDNTLGLTTPR